MIPEEGFQYDRSEFFEAMKLVMEYQVGNKYYFMLNTKIVQGVVQEVGFRVYDHGMTSTVKNKLSIELSICIKYGSSSHTIPANKLFKTREEVAEQFLKDNDVPKELLRVLKQEKPKTTVADLLEKLKDVAPETDLEAQYSEIIRIIGTAYNQQFTGIYVDFTSDYWDCECERRYIHPSTDEICPTCKAERTNQPDSKICEVVPENLYQFRE
jgi:hypothetical protein